jgi:ribosomal protein L11 methyltransferase
MASKIRGLRARKGWGLAQNSKSSHEIDDVAGPYGDLYIYLIRGPVKEKNETAFGSAFLGNWVEDDNSFLFFSKPSFDAVSRLLKNESGMALIDDYHFTYEQWQGGPSKSIKVENLLIAPPWVKIEAHGDERKIILDPGVVFGTGMHPTTRDCLKAMVTLRKYHRMERVLDLGTGTGILALGAIRLGAQAVTAVDLNPLCVKTAKRNVLLNKLERRIRVFAGKAEDFLDVMADLVISNIHHGAVATLLGTDGFRRKGWLIISGLMRSQARDVKAELGKSGLKIIHEWDHEMTWYTFLVKNEEGRLK